MKRGKILIVEDEKNLGLTLLEYLQALGRNAFLATTAAEATELFTKESPSIILMDIGLPDGNGLDLAKKFRSLKKDLVLLFLSALNDPDTRVQGLELGAHDYITKPFALKELVLRLEMIEEGLKRLESTKDELIFGPLKIRFKQFEVEDAHGEVIALSHKENSILEFLYSKKEHPVTREEIIKNIWGENKFPSNRTVDNYIVKLRRWCETDEQGHLSIESIRGIGYKLTTKE